MMKNTLLLAGTLIVAAVLLSLTAANGVFAQDAGEPVARFSGMYMNGGQLIYEVKAAYSGTLGGLPVDVEYNIFADPKAFITGTLPFQKRQDGQLALIIYQGDTPRTAVMVKGKITQRAPDGSTKVTELDEIVFPESKTVTSAWLMSQQSAFPKIRLADAAFLPNSLVLGDPEKKLPGTTQATLFQIGSDYRLTLAQRPTASPKTPVSKKSTPPKK
jgi:hypothetical protein